MNYKYILIVFSLTGVASLTGCATAVVGAAAVGGFKVARDERTVGVILDDSVISTSVKTRMISDEFVKARHVDVDVLNGVVYLIGVVESSSQKRMAADIARRVNGVRRVENQLIVSETTIGSSLDDAILASRIKAQLLKEPDIRSANIDVDTNNNIITLTGIVRSPDEENTTLSIVEKVTAGRRQIVNNLKVAN